MKSQVRINAEKDPTYCPYCLRCSRPWPHRMSKVEDFYWRCPCGAEHDERDGMIPVALVFKKGDYDDRQIIDFVLGYNEIRMRMIKNALGQGTLVLGKWVQKELRERDLELSEILGRADEIAKGQSYLRQSGSPRICPPGPDEFVVNINLKTYTEDQVCKQCWEDKAIAPERKNLQPGRCVVCDEPLAKKAAP